jgi:DNA-binding winged helix-turn-helix (wHTH) protein
VQCGPFFIDSGQRRILRDGVALHLTPKAFDLVHVLITEAPRVVSKRELHELLWTGTFVSDSSLTGLIKEIRRVLEADDADAEVIRTVHRVGYAWAVAIEPARHESRPWHWLVVNGRRVVLQQRENIIGRDPASGIWLDVPGISRRHARIVIDGEEVVLEDLGSKNGTTVGNTPVHAAVALHDGDRIRFGSVDGLYRRSGGGMSTETQSRLPGGSAPSTAK